MADRATKEACTVGSDTSLLIPRRDFCYSWKDHLFNGLDEWSREIGHVKGVKYFQNFYVKGRKPWFDNFALSREIIVSFNRLRSNHTSLAESHNRFDIVESPGYPCGSALQSDNHVFW